MRLKLPLQRPASLRVRSSFGGCPPDSLLHRWRSPPELSREYSRRALQGLIHWLLQQCCHEAQGRRTRQEGVFGSTKSPGRARSTLPVPPPLLLVARTLLPMTFVTRPFRLPSLQLARSPHAGALASDSAFWCRRQIVRDALLPAPRAFVQWVFLVPMACFYKLDGKRLSGGKISFAIVSKRSRHLLNRELTVFGLRRRSAAISS